MALTDRLNLRNLYLYLVCLITLVVSIFAAVQLVRSVVSLAYPDPGYYGYYGYVEPGQEPVSEEERERQEQIARDSQQRQSVLEQRASDSQHRSSLKDGVWSGSNPWRRGGDPDEASVGLKMVESPT